MKKAAQTEAPMNGLNDFHDIRNGVKLIVTKGSRKFKEGEVVTAKTTPRQYCYGSNWSVLCEDANGKTAWVSVHLVNLVR